MSLVDNSLQPRGTPRAEPIRVMIVDDAIVVRGLLVRWIEAEVGLQVVASLRSGREAIEQMERADPDVVILDVDMPDIDGITALPRLLARKPGLVVIMSSTLTRRNAEISLRALSLGAADYIPKPQSTREITNSASFRRDLIEKVRTLGARARQRLRARAPAWAKAPERPAPGARTAGIALRPAAGSAAQAQAEGTPLRLRPFPAVAPRVLLIGSSTGGPQALIALFSQIGDVIDQAPVLVTQHMPPTFTTVLAELLTRTSGRAAQEAVDGEVIRAGRIYIAPGGRHMRAIRRDGVASVALDDGPLINFCRPAVDPMFSSATETWGSWNLALVLTGMGSDGTRGAGDIVAAGGSVIAQDEDTSVVWGMPGSVAKAGLCSAVLPIEQIPGRITSLFAGSRS
jgi:two-component system, chemotaxis family, protein-glutamate methylesterase/glutaminase